MTTPRPLAELIAELRSASSLDDGQVEAFTKRACADELEQWARAWGERIEQPSICDDKFVRERILGLPAKEK